MMLKRSTRQLKPKSSARLVRAGLAGLAAVTAVAGLATGCLDRKVVPAKPTTSNVFVDQIVQTAVDKIDLLFMIDNSVSMADKQEILKAAVPVLLSRLVTPICLQPDGVTPDGMNSDPNTGLCANTADSPEFSPIGDIHIGIVSSSLGAHGGSVCSAPSADDATATPPITEYLDDKGELVGAERPGVTTWNNNSGFLAWDPSGLKNNPPGENNSATLNTDFANLVEATGEHGCGYEASLEAWYRFLIDPEPPASVTRVGNSTVRSSKLVFNADGSTTCMGCDTTLLAQRKAFLRPDSLVAVVMLSDENDCSIQDEGVGWFVGASTPMPKATQACTANPNDPCCRSCAQNEPGGPPSGCMALSADPVCMGAAAGSYNTWPTTNDSLNLRCYDQKQRFGFDLLYSTQRYVNGLTSTTLNLESDSTKSVVNPLFDPGTSGAPPRSTDLVFLAGIVGVPWQDISDDASLASPTTLNYLTAADLITKNRWPQLLGDPTTSPPTPPSDPFMIETTGNPAELPNGAGHHGPRMGTNPNVPGASIVQADSMNPTANPINGHEQNVTDMADLEFACTFKLATARTCNPGDSACDCAPTKNGDASLVTMYNSPLCQPPGGGPAGTTQYFAKAYPGARELQVLKDFGANAIVASICPKVTTCATPCQDPNYGYNPAVAAIISRLKEALKGKCLPRALAKQPGADGGPTNQVECEVIEAQKAGKCNCPDPTNATDGRVAADPSIKDAVFRQLQAAGSCGGANQPGCDDSNFCMCEIVQEQGDALAQCQADAPTVSTPGYCYIDDPASMALKNCPDNQKRLLRFVDDGTSKVPAQGAIAFIACLGANIDQAADGG
ncbi:MAG TPA: hypothetical protein VK745_26205 [Polyangiaceae bacterium]|jgi:hypothetical protein|nr:hypothetical protein [Polyangiaceae bacterium]